MAATIFILYMTCLVDHIFVLLELQNKTMQMMYETIYRALKEAGLDEIYEPQDYLNFFCLGNREVPDSTSTSKASNTSNNPQVRLPVYPLVFHSTKQT
jgi:hypothetical protein